MEDLGNEILNSVVKEIKVAREHLWKKAELC